MELRHLKLVETVAKVGTLTKAAELLYLTQSALSHQLKEIEEELGVLMFIRVKKRLVISEAGKVIRDTAKNIYRELEEAKIQLQNQLSGQQGSIRLSTECYTCYHWLPGVLAGFQKEFQHIEVEILPEFTKNHFNGLINKRLDLVITSEKMIHEKIQHKYLFRDEQLVVVSKDHPWVGKPFVTAEDFSEVNLIIYQKPAEQSQFYRNFLMADNVSPKSIIEIRLTEAAIEMVKNNFGVKVMASWAATPYLKSKELVAIPLTANGLFRNWYLAYNIEASWQPHYNYFTKHLMTSLQKSLANL
jgi:LysR family transcriptional regulator for metE and metH